MTITKQEAWRNFTNGIKTIQNYSRMAVEKYNSLLKENNMYDYRFRLGKNQKPKWISWTTSNGEEEHLNTGGEGKPKKSDIYENHSSLFFIYLEFVDYSSGEELGITVVFNEGQWEAAIQMGSDTYKFQEEYFLSTPSTREPTMKNQSQLEKLYDMVRNLSPEDRMTFTDEIMCEYADEELLIHHVKERDIQYVSGVYEAIDLLEEKTGNYIVIPKIGTIKEAIQDLISKY